MTYEAIINVPGYLPDTDEEPPTFDTAQEAWAYLAQERETAEDNSDYEDPADIRNFEYTEAWEVLKTLAATEGWDEDAPVLEDGTGVVFGDTPGYSGSHDLGVAYEVRKSE